MAVDQIALQIQETRWNEGSAFSITANFRTRSTGAADTPTNVYWRLDCLTTGAELADWTSASAASSVTLSITPTHNAIQNDGNDYEVKQLTVAADYGLSTQYVEAIQWRVDNLFGSP